MPNRYIKESCTSSPTLTKLSDAAERFFWRLTTVADDYGRFDANLDVLRGRCVPTLSWPKKKVEMCLHELCHVAHGEQRPLVQLYQVGGRVYGAFCTWNNHQRDRSKERNPPKPKFPGPEEGSRPPAATCGDSRPPAALNESENENENEKSATPQPAAMARVRFEEFWQAYPSRNGKKLERGTTLTLFQKLSDMDQALAVQAARNYAEALKSSDISAKDPKRFLRNGHGEEPWRDWIEPAVVKQTNSVPPVFHKHGPSLPQGEPAPEEVRSLLSKIGRPMRVEA